MNASFLYPPPGKDDVAPKRSSGAAVNLSASVANQGDRACCCPAKEVVRVIMPPTPTRPDATDLLLCGHHYRVSRRALAAAHAVVHELSGIPRDTAAWIYDDHDRSLAPAERADLSGERTVMKLITAIIRPEKLGELIEVVIDKQAHGLTVTEVRGFGRQFGRLAADRADPGPDAGGWAVDRRAALLPKVRLEILVLDDDTETLVEAIAKHARTETLGDGKIWVSTVDSALRVRTGQRDRDAV